MEMLPFGATALPCAKKLISRHSQCPVVLSCETLGYWKYQPPPSVPKYVRIDALIYLIVVLSNKDFDGVSGNLVGAVSGRQHELGGDQRSTAKGLGPDPGPNDAHLEGYRVGWDGLAPDYSRVAFVGTSAGPTPRAWNGKTRPDPTSMVRFHIGKIMRIGFLIREVS